MFVCVASLHRLESATATNDVCITGRLFVTWQHRWNVLRREVSGRNEILLDIHQLVAAFTVPGRFAVGRWRLRRNVIGRCGEGGGEGSVAGGVRCGNNVSVGIDVGAGESGWGACGGEGNLHGTVRV